MNWRWKTTKTTTAGMTSTTAPARIEPNGFAADRGQHDDEGGHRTHPATVIAVNRRTTKEIKIRILDLDCAG